MPNIIRLEDYRLKIEDYYLKFNTFVEKNMSASDDNIIVFKTFDNPFEANIIKTRLEANGIECFLSNENLKTLAPIFNTSTGGVRLHIFEHDFDKVTEILSTDESLSSDDTLT
jgi:hypothetical protein